MIRYILFWFLTIVSVSSSEQLRIFAVDTTDFPIMSAKFYILDTEGEQVKDFTQQDFSISENGIPRKIINVTCPNDPEIIPYSMAVSLDISGSMDYLSAIKLGKTTARELCNMLDMPPSEMALQICNDKPMIVTDFTTNKERIRRGINQTLVGGANDFVAHLMDPETGLLPLAKNGKNKKLAVLLTDAYYGAMSAKEVQDCINYCLQHDITFYSIVYSKYSVNDRGIRSSLSQICKSTDGLFIDGITTEGQAIDIARQIQELEPCEISWESDYLCRNEVQELVIDIPKYNLFFQDKYYQSSKAISKLKLSPGAIYFENKPIGVTFDTTMTVTAIGYSYNVSNIISSNPAFEINPKSFTLNPGESITLNISFTPDAEQSYNADIEFVNDKCQVHTNLAADYPGVPNAFLELKITHPNGGEEFLVGTDTVITWEGSYPNDTLQLEYSTNDGANWSILTDKATGNEYKWNNIPLPVSQKCAIKASKGRKIPKDNNITVVWETSIDGKNDDFFTSVIESQYGGYYMGGCFMSEDVVAGQSFYTYDLLIAKIGEAGSLEWQKVYGGKYSEQCNSLDANDNGLIAVGVTNSNGGDVSGNHGGNDIWALQLDYNGVLQWQKCYGGSKDDWAERVIKTMDNGYLIVGYTESSDGDVVAHHGEKDAWVIKIDAAGNIQWSRSLGGSEDDQITDVKQLNDGTYIMVGSTASSDGDVVGHFVGSDVWILQLDVMGDILWQKCYGTIGTDIAHSISITGDGDYFVVGQTNSFGNDLSGLHGYIDVLAMKVDDKGNMIWQKCFGGKNDDYALSAQTTIDGGLIMGGTSESTNDDVNDNKGAKDFWILKVIGTGELQWKKSFGGSERDEAFEIIQTKDYGFLVAGVTNSGDGDVGTAASMGACWAVKLSKDSFSDYQEDVSDRLFSVEQPDVQSIDIDLGDELIGEKKDTIISNFIENVDKWDCKIKDIKIIGADADYFNLNGPMPPYELSGWDKQYAEFRFSPTEPRTYSAEIEIITQVGTLRQTIKGRGLKIQLLNVAENIDFGEHKILSKVDSNVVMIRNISNIPLDITKVEMLGPDEDQFLFVDANQLKPFKLQPQEEYSMDLRYQPIYLGKTSGRIAFYYNGSGSPTISYLYGIGNGTSMSVSSDSCRPGERISLNVGLMDVNMSAFAQTAVRYEGELRLRNNILYPVNKDALHEISLDSITVKFEGQTDGNSPYITQILMTAVLGDAETTDINIQDINFFDVDGNILPYDIVFQSGYFKLLGICREGGARLINPVSKIGLQQVSPNPAGDYVDVNLILSEKGYTTLTLTDLQGKKIRTVFSEDVSEFGDKMLRMNISDLDSGKYMLILSTPSVVEKEFVLIVK